MLSTVLSYLSTPIYADAAPEESKSDEGKDEKKEEEVEEKEEDDSEKKEGGEEKEEEEEEEEEEEDEPEDLQPVFREECQSSAKCAPLKQHFEHCQEKVQNGQGFKGEDCVEEMFHLMHCADECAGPRLFTKLR